MLQYQHMECVINTLKLWQHENHFEPLWNNAHVLHAYSRPFYTVAGDPKRTDPRKETFSTISASFQLSIASQRSFSKQAHWTNTSKKAYYVTRHPCSLVLVQTELKNYIYTKHWYEFLAALGTRLCCMMLQWWQHATHHVQKPIVCTRTGASLNVSDKD